MQEAVIVVAKYFVAIPVLGAVYTLVRASGHARKRLLIALVLNVVFTALLVKLATTVYHDPRPFVRDNVTPLFSSSTDNGFPSDHTAFSAMLAWVVLTQNRVLGIVLLIVALLIGGARVLSGVHHGWDVTGGFAIASLSFCLSGLLIHFVRKARDRIEPDEE